MKPNKKTELDDPRNRLLADGADLYLNAVTALIEYQKEVQKKCREVLKNHIEDYGAAIKPKTQLKTNEIKNGAWPAFDEWDGSWWTLGTHIVRRNVIPAIRWWEMTCCLEYCLEYEHSKLICYIGEWYNSRKLAADLYQKFHRLNSEVMIDANTVWIQAAVDAEERANFDEPLDGLLQEWIRLWKKVGGMKEVFRA